MGYELERRPTYAVSRQATKELAKLRDQAVLDRARGEVDLANSAHFRRINEANSAALAKQRIDNAANLVNDVIGHSALMSNRIASLSRGNPELAMTLAENKALFEAVAQQTIYRYGNGSL